MNPCLRRRHLLLTLLVRRRLGRPPTEVSRGKELIQRNTFAVLSLSPVMLRDHGQVARDMLHARPILILSISSSSVCRSSLVLPDVVRPPASLRVPLHMMRPIRSKVIHSPCCCTCAFNTGTCQRTGNTRSASAERGRTIASQMPICTLTIPVLKSTSIEISLMRALLGIDHHLLIQRCQARI